MFSPKTIKFFSSLVFAALFSSCWWRQTGGETAATPAPFVAETSKSAIPFETKEPENYQADLIIKTGGIESKIFTARNGADTRVDYYAGENQPTSHIRRADGTSFLILNDEKIYAESVAAQTLANAAQTSNEVADFLNNEWLNAKADARFTSLGVENGLTRYRVGLNESADAEIIVYINESFRLPFRQEFYSVRGTERTLTYSVEMRNFKLVADAALFDVPADYKRVSHENLREVLHKRENLR